MSAALLYAQGRLPIAVMFGGAVFVLISLVALTALIEGRRWAPALEAARLVAALLAAAVLMVSQAGTRAYFLAAEAFLQVSSPAIFCPPIVIS